MKNNRALKHIALIYSVIVLSCAMAWAGTGAGSGVAIYHTINQASGSPHYVRNSPDDVQDIGCRVTTQGINGDELMVECEAIDAQGQSLACSSTQSAFVKVARALPNFGWIMFKTDGAGTCTFMNVRIGSLYFPQR